MSRCHFGSMPAIKLNNQPLSQRIADRVSSVVVESSLSAAGVCRIEIADPRRDLLSGRTVDFGDTVTVSASPVESLEQVVLFKGDVYGLDIEATPDGTFVTIRAYDPSYRLRQHRRTAVYRNVTDRDVLVKLARRARVEVSGSGPNSTKVHEQLSLVNETPWDFLVRRAMAIDCVLHVDAGRLCMTPFPRGSQAPRPGDHESSDWRQLVPGHNLLWLHVRQSAAQQFGSIEARGWNPTTKRAVKSSAKPSSRGALATTTPQQLGERHGGRQRTTAHPSLIDAEACDLLARSMAERVGSTHLYAEGEALGHPRLVAGEAVSIGQIGSLEGRYVISSARHQFGGGGYRTEVTISGTHDRSLYGLLSGSGGAAGRFPGVYPALVENNKDPDRAGRVRLSFPWLDDDYVSDWARVMTIGGGPKTGIQWPPEVDDEVMVAFLGGDPEHPVVLSGMYNGKDKAPADKAVNGSSGRVEQRLIQTRLGHRVVFSDKKGDEHILIETADASHCITLDQKGKKIQITSSGEVTVAAKGDIKINATGKIDLDAKRDITINANGRGTISAKAGLKIESTGPVEVKGAQIKLN